MTVRAEGRQACSIILWDPEPNGIVLGAQSEAVQVSAWFQKA